MTRPTRRELATAIDDLAPAGDAPETVVLEETVVGTEYDREGSEDSALAAGETRTETTEIETR